MCHVITLCYIGWISSGINTLFLLLYRDKYFVFKVVQTSDEAESYARNGSWSKTVRNTILHTK
jgi:hypothetical protein